MPETPRSAKRRRLDGNSSTAAASSPAASTRRKSDRKSLIEEIDMYDDIDGALQEGSSSRRNDAKTASARKSTGKRKGGRPQISDEEPPKKRLFSSLPGRRPRDLLMRKSAAKDVFVDGDGIQDELGQDAEEHDDENIALDAEIQLLGEAAIVITPSKRKRGGRMAVNTEPEPGRKDMEMVDAALEDIPPSTDLRSGSKGAAEREEIHEEAEEIPKATPRRGRPPKKKRNRKLPDNADQMELDQLPNGRAESNSDTQPAHKSPKAAKSAKTATLEDCSREFALLKSIVLAKLANRRPTPLTNLTTEYTKVHTLMSATIQSGESNSMLLIGARGSGKTTLINKALKDLSQSSKEYFHVVRLNGFVQTDNKLSLREIWRQLGREMEIDSEENGPGKSYADTLAMLLALLSHPDEIAGKAVNQVAKSVIFVMDEFDLFATHPRQTLLYNLLDIAQSRKAPIAVLGLTTRIDVTEALEKRVKSRFSHRYVHLGLPRGMGQFVDLGKAACMVTSEELGFDEKAVLEGNKMDSWNDAVNALFTDASFLKQYVRPVYHTTKSLPTLCSSLLIPTSTLNTFPTPPHYTTTISPLTLLQPPDSNLSLLATLSDLSLSLLIAASRLTIIHDTESLNFALAHAEYVSLASKARINSAAAGQLATGSGTRLFSKEIARKEWEGLVQLGLVVPVGAGAFGLGMGGRGGKEGEMFRVDVALEEIPGAVAMGGEGLSKVMDRWCRQI